MALDGPSFTFHHLFLMKRIFSFLAALLVASGLTAQAQTPATSTTQMSTSSSKMTTTKTAPAPTQTTRTTTTSEKGMMGVHKMKADGTPDMRYKSNKSTTTTKTGPMTKSGTPDMRYKSNKTTTTTTTNKM
jgi:hypothetical protein